MDTPGKFPITSPGAKRDLGSGSALDEFIARLAAREAIVSEVHCAGEVASRADDRAADERLENGGSRIKEAAGARPAASH